MEDWETALKIGHSVRAGAGARENVVKGKGALNAARRSGAVTTEKKFATGNAVSIHSSIQPSHTPLSSRCPSLDS